MVGGGIMDDEEFPFFYSSNIEELTGTEFSIYHTILEGEFIDEE